MAKLPKKTTMLEVAKRFRLYASRLNEAGIISQKVMLELFSAHDKMVAAIANK